MAIVNFIPVNFLLKGLIQFLSNSLFYLKIVKEVIDMKSNLLRLLLIIIVLSMTLVPVYAGNKAKLGDWASNGKTAIKVNKIEVVKTWKDLGKFIRYGKREEQLLSKVKQAVDSEEYKILLVHIDMRNDSQEHVNMGYYIFDHWGGYLYLRGEEGTEVATGGYFGPLSLGKDASGNFYCGASELTYYLSGGLAKKASIAPNAVIKGKVVFVVPDWFVPAKIFTKPFEHGFGSSELVVNLH